MYIGIKCGIPATPLAQELGHHVFEYGLYVHLGDWKTAKSCKYTEEFYAGCRSVQTDRHAGNLPKQMSFITADREELVMSAFKRSEDERGWILRMFNTRDYRV